MYVKFIIFALNFYSKEYVFNNFSILPCFTAGISFNVFLNLKSGNQCTF